MAVYNTSRVAFESIMKKYKEYLAIYKTFNNGSLQGATPFGEFYWRFSYLMKYEDNSQVNHNGY